MKVGIVLAKPPGYSETFFNSKIKGLNESGFDIILFTQVKQSHYNLSPVRTGFRLSSNPFKTLYKFIRSFFSILFSIKKVINFYRLEKKDSKSSTIIIKKIFLNSHILSADLDWIHFGFATMAIDRENLAEAIGAKMAVSFRGFDIDVYPLKNPGCYDLLWKKVNKVHSISNYLLLKSYDLGLPKTKEFQIINPAVLINDIGESIQLERKNDVLQILTIARLHWIKNIDLLIETAEFLKRKKVKFEWKVIGDGIQKDEERYQYHLIERDLENHVTLLGKRSHKDTLDILSQTDVYVQTSWSEGFCNAVLEAQSLGVLCLAMNVGGLKENIIHGKTGFLINSFNADKLGQSIIDVRNMDPNEKLMMEKNAMERVKKEFNSEQQIRDFIKFYKN